MSEFVSAPLPKALFAYSPDHHNDPFGWFGLVVGWQGLSPVVAKWDYATGSFEPPRLIMAGEYRLTPDWEKAKSRQQVEGGDWDDE
jgi:hypothetical protein